MIQKFFEKGIWDAIHFFRPQTAAQETDAGFDTISRCAWARQRFGPVVKNVVFFKGPGRLGGGNRWKRIRVWHGFFLPFRRP